MRAYRFRPSLLPSLMTALLLPCLISLGIWQLQRAEQKRVLIQLYETRLHQPAQPIRAINLQENPLDFLPVAVQGVFVNENNLFLQNKYYKHALGYHVITPFRIQGTDRIVLVDRGWIPRVEGAQQLPIIPAVQGSQTLSAYIKIPEKNLFAMNPKTDNTATWPRFISQLDLPQLRQQLKGDLYPFILLLKPDQAHGFVRDWYPVVAKPQKHTAYAVQWFSLAGLLIIIYLVVNIERKES